MSCQPDTTCRQDLRVNAGITIRWLQVDTTNITTTEQTAWDSITVQGIHNDSVLYDNQKNVSQLALPLRNDTNITMYSLKWHGMEEILYIRHDNTLQFVSMACGCVIYHNIDSVWCSGTWIDSVRLINSAVETVQQENVKVFTTQIGE